ncbi:hypothetical protein P43SY_001847 [Pythium insidiosum]|uniref:Calcineurin-like phosphoesterase domain-containing protein n=1 Tax=Pythium insidiosum TaxID=114742 RepID=A0AAD5LBI5_PYTIN|nr:hypothetical protein P43SY_001847 [Pythium insidiosum]
MLGGKTIAATLCAVVTMATVHAGEPEKLTEDWANALHQVEDVLTAFAKKNNLPVAEPMFPWLPGQQQGKPTTQPPVTGGPAPTTSTPETQAPVPTTQAPATSAPATKRPNPGQGQQQQQQQQQQQGGGGKPKCSVGVDPTNVHSVKVNCPTTDRVRFIGIGDWGEAFVAPYVLGVRDGVIKEAKTNKYDFILAVGDNFYAKGVKSTTDALWKTTWYDRWQIGSNLTLPWIAILGNHDWYGNALAEVEFSKSQEAGAKYWIMPDRYFSVDATVATGKKFKIAAVDTMTINTTAEFDWAEKEYNDPAAEFVLAAGHHHIYSQAKRGDNKDKPMVRLNQLIQASPKVKAYLCGHEHDMQYLRAADRDYFMFGGSGRTMNEAEVGPGTKAEVMYFKKKYGFAVFDVQLGSRTVTVTYHVFNNQGVEIETPVFTRQY